jgi:hypothetical protein
MSHSRVWVFVALVLPDWTPPTANSPLPMVGFAQHHRQASRGYHYTIGVVFDDV